MLDRDLLSTSIGRRFTLGELRTRGARAEVFEATEAGRPVLVKVYYPQTPAAKESLLGALALASRLQHPNNLGLLATNEVEEAVAVVSERASGTSLGRQLKALGPVPETRALHLGIQIVRALREAHSLGLVHGSLHPENVFVGSDGDDADLVKVGDYGAYLAGDSDTADPKYLTPEHFSRAAIDARTDVYGLGLLLYEMISGRPPFVRGDRNFLASAHLSEPVPSLRVANASIAISLLLEPIVLRCLEKKPEDRYPSIDVVGAHLQRRSSFAP